MLTYKHKATKQEDAVKNNVYENNENISWLYEHNVKINKAHQSHLDANIIDGTFIKKVLQEIIGVKLETILNYENKTTLNSSFADALM